MTATEQMKPRVAAEMCEALNEKTTMSTNPLARNCINARNRINVRSDEDLIYWMRELGVESKAVTSAVRAVGPGLEEVREYLQTRQRDPEG